MELFTGSLLPNYVDFNSVLFHGTFYDSDGLYTFTLSLCCQLQSADQIYNSHSLRCRYISKTILSIDVTVPYKILYNVILQLFLASSTRPLSVRKA